MIFEPLREAYKILFGTSPSDSLKEWEIAREVMEHFNGQKIPENVTKECIFRIVNHTIFPDSETTRAVVGRAEDLATEVFSELSGADPHMDVIGHLERLYYQKKEQKEVRGMEG